MILDTHSHVYIWIGDGSTTEERDTAKDVARQYLTTVGDGRSPDTPVVVVKSGEEPPMFSCHFIGWDEDRKAKLAEQGKDLYGERAKKAEAERKAKKKEEKHAREAELQKRRESVANLEDARLAEKQAKDEEAKRKS